MSARRRLVVVDNSDYQYNSIRSELSESGWEVMRDVDQESALFRFKQCQAQGTPIQAAAVDLGLPPGIDDPFAAGIPLIARLRQEAPALPILAYTSLTPLSFSYELALRALLRLKASFLYFRELSEKVTFAQLLELTWLGYVVVSPAAAEKLNDLIASRPDPLPDRLWETLKLLSSEKTYKEIAYDLGDLRQGGVKNRVSQIRDILRDAGELQPYQDQNEDLVNWYRRNKVRYCREG